MDAQAFFQKIKRLKVDRSKGAAAPHKALMLLAVIDGIESGEISSNHILITPMLVAKFKDYFCSMVVDERFQPNFALPFYHLRSEGFWHLQSFPGRELLLTSSQSISSFRALREAIAFAYLDQEVYQLFQNAEHRTTVRLILLATYLNRKTIDQPYESMMQAIETEILHEPPAYYQNEIAKADEEEKFIRNGVFKKIIPRSYNYTCCISGMRVIASRELQMIDACHIVPFAISRDDTISNGLSLCPNLHRAFDRFLITIDKHYKVIVSENFQESETYRIRTFHNEIILLPDNADYFPAVENLKWHNEQYYNLNH